MVAPVLGLAKFLFQQGQTGLTRFSLVHYVGQLAANRRSSVFSLLHFALEVLSLTLLIQPHPSGFTHFSLMILQPLFFRSQAFKQLSQLVIRFFELTLLDKKFLLRRGHIGFVPTDQPGRLPRPFLIERDPIGRNIDPVLDVLPVLTRDKNLLFQTLQLVSLVGQTELLRLDLFFQRNLNRPQFLNPFICLSDVSL